MKNYLGFENNKEKYAYDITAEQEETITNMLYYYRHHGVDDMRYAIM